MISVAAVVFAQSKIFAQNSKMDVDKICSIKFNNPIDKHSILDNIKVEDSKANIVNTTIEADNNIGEVNPPVDGYKSEGTYILKVLNIERRAARGSCSFLCNEKMFRLLKK